MPLTDAAPASRVRVAVCVATYNRPLLLGALLDSLGDLRFSGEAPELQLFVVDNDAEESARWVVEAAARTLHWPVSYHVEPVRNIALARNRGVAEALAWRAELVAFVDDDERVTPSWLATLLEVQRKYGASIVHGPVLTLMPEGTPEWLVRGGGFKRLHERTGRLAVSAGTGNALVNAGLLACENGHPFDPAFGLSGGSDALFFTRCQRAGATIVWADDAVVEEQVSPQRARLPWMLRRAFREGNAALFCERAQPPQTRQRLRQVARAGARLTIGVCGGVVAPLRGRAAMVRSLRHLAYGAGTMAALVGHRFYEYAAVDRPPFTVGEREVPRETVRSAVNGTARSHSGALSPSSPPSSGT
jgi:succinoglycan biosynthesis protein ExoM